MKGVAVLHGLGRTWSTSPDPTAQGIFLRGETTEPGCFVEIPLGRIVALKHFTSAARFRPFWVQAVNGRNEEQVCPETQWLLAETMTGIFILLVPLLDDGSSFSLRGGKEGLVLVGETGDPAVVVTGGVALFAATGTDPYALLAAGAVAVQRHHAAGALRKQKPAPDFIDLFGWCTWDAFYKEVSAENIRAGLASFAGGGVEPRLLILDDGWQSTRRTATGEERLAGFTTNDRFADGLAPVVQEAKRDFRIQRFLVWHALLGYWGGICETSLPGYETRAVPRAFGPGILRGDPHWNVRPWGAVVGVPSAARAPAFFDDYHRWLRSEGVDGVKVDNQTTLEAVSAGQGGRVVLARAYRQALESSVARHFGGRMINSMSNSPECLYLAARSTVMRTSDDFWPLRADSHGAHVYTNAHASLWFGEFMQPDWDMFQSDHPCGAFHAAARAVSGGPVYVSDRPRHHNFALLRKLTLSDGTILRADGPGRVTRDGLFADPTVTPVLLKVFNTNRDCGVVGLFNARNLPASAEGEVTYGEVGPQDVPPLVGDAFAAYAHRTAEIWRCQPAAPARIGLRPGEWEIVSFAPVRHGFAAFGLADKLNSTGAITRCTWQNPSTCEIDLRDGGSFVAWAARSPVAVEADGAMLAFNHAAADGRLSIAVPVGGPRVLLVRWT